MFISWKQFTSSTVAKMCVGVECDKCGCTYYYELSRIGSGTGTALYGVGQTGASRAANDNSLTDLQQRLATEAELVPCPKCNWINDELVTGFRQGRYRGLLTTGGLVAIVGTVISLFSVWILSVGPAPDRGAIPYFLVGGIGASISFMLVTLVLQIWLRNRIQPNRDYPLPPRIPPGTPESLFLDDETGELKPASTNGSHQPMEDAPVEIQIGRHTLPAVCCRCLQDPDPSHSQQVPVLPAISLEIPLCKACAKAISRRKLLIWAVVTAMGFPVMCLGLWVARLQKEEFWIFFAVSCALAPTLGGIAAHLLERPARVKVVDSARGIVRIRFENRGYLKHINLEEKT
ncbi:MAG: hypothetical protein H8E66_02235 [Planctomycetes bacterium]|nr:hypothetical protein [Planctomycetota bacterium]